MIQIRARHRRAAVAMGAALILTAAPIGTSPAYADSQVEAYTIGTGYGLYKSTGNAPALVHGEHVAPPGAGIATIRSGSGSVTAFAIGVNGGLVMSRTLRSAPAPPSPSTAPPAWPHPGPR